MRKLDSVPSEVMDLIRTEHEKAMVLLSGQKPVLTLPTRKVKMRIDRPSKGYRLEDVIVPETLVYYTSNLLSEGTMYDTRSLIYHLSLTKKPFPYGHIYQSSGYVCLGGIFVPSHISIYNPSQPLEALFLKNDHNTGHGNADIKITINDIQDVLDILQRNNITTSSDIKKVLKAGENLIANDAIWILSADVCSQLPLERSIYVMDEIFRVIFSSTLEEEEND